MCLAKCHSCPFAQASCSRVRATFLEILVICDMEAKNQTCLIILLTNYNWSRPNSHVAPSTFESNLSQFHVNRWPTNQRLPNFATRSPVNFANTLQESWVEGGHEKSY